MLKHSPQSTHQVTVAVCIPTYNQAQYLEIAVRSVLNQSFQGEIEIWVSDDASTDETPEVMQKICAQFPKVNYHRQSQNKGIATNNSYLMRLPQTKYLVRLDSDDTMESTFIEKTVRALEENPQAGYAHTAIQYIDKAGKPFFINRLARDTGYQEPDTALRTSLLGYRTAANILTFPTLVLKSLAYYDNRPEFGEDYDLSVRIADAGYGNVYLDEVLASYRVWNDDQNKRARRKKIQLAGYIRIFDESLQPAFARRGWDLKAVRRQRQRLANLHAVACTEKIFSAGERAQLRELLFQLGDSYPLRGRLALCRLGLAPLLSAVARFQLETKRLAKRALKILR